MRLVILTVERVAFNRLGAGERPLATALVAYGGAAILLVPVALLRGGTLFTPGAILPGVIYAGSFFLYVWALQVGPLAVVAPWPAATSLLLWIWRPDGGWAALAAVLLLVAGGLLSAGTGSGQGRRGILVMLLSDVLLAVGRELDSGAAAHGELVAYAATVFLVVALLFFSAAGIFRQLRTGIRLAARRPGWSLAAALTNGAAYLTVVALLQYWPPYLTEALSGAAGILTTAVAVIWLQETQAARRLAGAGLMAVGAGLLLLVRA